MASDFEKLQNLIIKRLCMSKIERDREKKNYKNE